MQRLLSAIGDTNSSDVDPMEQVLLVIDLLDDTPKHQRQPAGEHHFAPVGGMLRRRV